MKRKLSEVCLTEWRIIMRIALLQTSVVDDKERNLEQARLFVSEAASGGAEIAVLPEMFNCPYETEKFPIFAEERGDKSWQTLSSIARENRLCLVGGSIPEREGGRLYNTCYVFDADGNQIAMHRKAHLFDINIRGKQSFRESDTFTPGDSTCLFDYSGHRFGVSICFDIRFPELFRNMAIDGAEAVFVPAAFNMTTGPLHWELAFRSRAVDNQYFTVGVAPARGLNGRYVSFANSLVCDPWGIVIANAGENAGVVICDIDLDLVSCVREQLPILSARRPELYKLQ